MTLILLLELCGAAFLATFVVAFGMWEWRRRKLNEMSIETER